MKRYLYYYVLFTSLLLAACGPKERRYVIGVSQCSEDIWRDKLNEELVMGTYQHEGVKLRFASAGDNDRLQMEQIEQMIRDRVDLIIVSPNQVHTISRVIDKAYDSGIPVILFDRKTDSRKYTAFIGADNVEVGRQLGAYVARQMGGRGTVVEISGLRGSSPAIDRSRGLAEALSRYPDVKMVARSSADWTETGGRRAMTQVMGQAGQHIDYVVAQNDRMALGAREAARRAGRREIRLVGIDALAVKGGGLEAVRDGKLEATYIYPTRGDLVMQLAMNILEHRPYRRDNYLKGALVTPDNANVLLMQHDELDKQTAKLNSLHGKVDLYLAQYNHQKMYIVFSGIITVMLLGIVFYVWRTMVMRRRMQDEALQAKLQFFTNISHELRTPLTLIADPVDYIIGDRNLSAEQRSMLEVVQRNVDVLKRLVSELLDFRKVQNGKMTLQLTDFDLAEAMHRWLDLFALSARRKRIDLQLHVDGPLMVRADRNKVERICYNLLSNAMKYTPEGGRITLAARTQDGQVTLSVADTGRGIARKEQAQVFDRFYQTSDSAGGTGIGLALVKAFADLHHGRAWVESEEGRGATFCVCLPLRQEGEVSHPEASGQAADEPRAAAAATATPINAGRHMDDLITTDEGERPEVLIIDDNSDIRGYLRTALNGSYRVSEAANGREGLEMARRMVPDLIISDVMMPVMDGLELCRRLRQDHAISHIPVILLTARHLEDQRAEGYEQGADAYISKPFSLRLLQSRIDNLLQSRRRLSELYGQHAASADDEGEVAEAARRLPSETDRTFIGQLRRIIQERLADSELTVEAIGEEIGLSRVQLYRKVKALTGHSPVEMLRKARLSRARHLLQTTEMSVSEVAYAVGFTTPSYFSKCYREEYGMQPGQER